MAMISQVWLMRRARIRRRSRPIRQASAVYIRRRRIGRKITALYGALGTTAELIYVSQPCSARAEENFNAIQISRLCENYNLYRGKKIVTVEIKA